MGGSSAVPELRSAGEAYPPKPHIMPNRAGSRLTGMRAENPAVTWLATDEPHPARDAQRNALACACAGNKEGWLALWAEDCEIFDPVGPPNFHAQRLGPRGRTGIEPFGDVAIAPL